VFVWSSSCFLCTQCCQCFWIVHSELPLRFYRTLIYGQFYWWRKPVYLKKTTDMPQEIDKLLSHYFVSSTPRHERGSKSQL
jgi:hypothetical protein